MRREKNNLVKIQGQLLKGVGFSLIYFLISVTLFAQYTVRIDVYDPAQKNDIYLTGTFNNWNPGNINYKLNVLDSTRKSITLKGILPGRYFFKFTRGSWATVESTEFGFDIEDRAIEIVNDTAVQLTIAGWIDEYLNLSGLPDSTRLKVGWLRSYYFLERNLDSSYAYAMASFELSKKINDKIAEVSSLTTLGAVLQKQGNSAKALELLFQALRILESQRDSLHLVLVNKNIGDIFESQNDYARARHYYQNSVKYTSLFDIRSFLLSEVLLSLGEIYFNISELDSAEYSARRSEKLHPSTGAALLLGDIERKRGNKMKAMQYYRLSVAAESLINSTSVNLAKVYLRLAQEFKEDNQLDSGFYYSRLSLAIARQVKDPFGIADASKLLSVFFEQRNRLDSAYFYQQVVIKANDSLFTREKEKQIHNLVFNEQLRKQEVEAEKERLRSRAWIYTLAGGLFALLLIAVLLVRNIRQKKGANILLGRQKDQIENTLAELKATQAQLIQSEKMASLGELTAGIAHEIQNPLNFVNNFSELNTELIEEMKEELRTGKNEEAIAIANDIKNNEQKINYHGKRADSIVKGMLQHSRNSSGQKELTDINVLADECLRLSYHGIRAKDKSFNSGTQTEFDSKIPLVRIVPQEIGRVLLNLLTNAFYSVMQKNKQLGDNYEPMVLVKTSLQDSRVIVSVWDNGKGIPKNVIDKIFQPFFTTKPTGEGTGLGLSMSYDIVTKTHGGEFRVESAELEWAEFTIILPI